MITRRTMVATFLFAATATLIGFSNVASAADDGLYQDVFDPNSSFVRVLAQEEAFAAINGETVRDFKAGLSNYVNVMPGPIEITLPEGGTVVDVAPSKHYTIVSKADGTLEILEDSLSLSPAKADVSLYNLTDVGGIDLYVPLAKAVAIKGVGSEDAKSVTLKAPLTLDFDLRSGSESLASVGGVELKRKAGVTIVLSENSGSFSAQAVQNTYLK